MKTIDSSVVHSVKRFIDANWDETVRFHPRDEGTLLGLPFPYTIPSRKGAFQELYYWDTFFTCLGLLESGRGELAIGNARNLLAMLDRHGFVPNGNRTFYLTRSQPPYLAPLVWHLAAVCGDENFARAAVPSLRREYEFWMTRRMTPAGLCRHFHHADPQALLDFFPEIVHRGALQGRKAEECLEEISQLMAECETGWDFNPRFEKRCADFCPVDLNSTLFIYERFFAEFGDAEERDLWLRRAGERRQKLNELCWDEEKGAFFDYDFKNGRRGTMLSAACFDPLWAGLATPVQARLLVEKALPQLELAHGVTSCAPGKRDRVRQWDHPNGWPCIQHIVYRGLDFYGYHDEARRIAEKYVATVGRCFEETGDLWEKYNAEEGSVKTPSETGYNASAVRDFDSIGAGDGHGAPPAMMGWTAGVFLDAVSFLAGRASALGHQRTIRPGREGNPTR